MKKMHETEGTVRSRPITFHKTINKTGKNNTGIEVPEEIIEKLGTGKRPLVRMSIKGYAYRSAVAVMNSKYMVSLSAAKREKADVQGGERPWMLPSSSTSNRAPLKSLAI